MKILVCVKQVPDLETTFKPNPEGTWFDETDLAFQLNDCDEYAVEEAVRLKEKLAGAPDITVLSIGPRRVVETIKRALAMGADRGVHIEDAEAYRKDPWQIASLIANFAREKKFDLIFTGMQSQDRGSGQVGVLAAELLGLACATTIVAFEFTGGLCRVRRELAGGVKGVVELKLPALLTCQSGLNVPRYPTLPNIMKARKKELLTVGAETLGKEGPAVVTEKFYPPARKGAGVVLEGEAAETADKLAGILREKIPGLRGL
ncbi:MAG: electron transfer flavoprotein subunit beta/FixA family protein [Elusimicrobia bacterium]|nr:electron transfer flavoprotein subunit beta/FixA family protein [Elusimicrobiota bacterium]